MGGEGDYFRVRFNTTWCQFSQCIYMADKILLKYQLKFIYSPIEKWRNDMKGQTNTKEQYTLKKDLCGSINQCDQLGRQFVTSVQCVKVWPFWLNCPTDVSADICTVRLFPPYSRLTLLKSWTPAWSFSQASKNDFIYFYTHLSIFKALLNVSVFVLISKGTSAYSGNSLEHNFWPSPKWSNTWTSFAMKASHRMH